MPSVRLTKGMDSKFVDTEWPSPITEWAVPLASQQGDAWWASGTAVIVAPFLAITAKHVIDDHWLRQEGSTRPEGVEGAGSFSLVAVQVTEVLGAAMWAVRKIWPSPHSDIAFLKLEPFNEAATKHKWRWPTLNVLPPAVGSRVSAFGYHSSFVSPGDPIEWRQAASTSHGRVEEVFDVRRDAVQLTYPCFSVDARFDGGMSGGPVFNEAGELCGLICSSIPAVAPETRHTSYVTSLWPALGIPLDMDRVGKPSGYYPAIELAQGGEIVARNWQRVGVDFESPRTSAVSLRPQGAT